MSEPMNAPMNEPMNAPMSDPTPDTAVIDLAILAEVIGNDPARLRKFAGKFVDTTATALTELQVCLERGDIARIRELGHRIKSSARIVGALGMGDLCEHLEKIPAADTATELAAARALIAQIAPLFERISSAVASLPSPPP